MKPIRIDFADERVGWRCLWRFDARMPATRFAVACALLALAAGSLALVRGQALRQATADTHAQHMRLQAARDDAARRAGAQLRLAAADQALLRQGELQRALPWEAIFQAFESAPPVRLHTFEPDLARGVVKVQASLADVAALQQYLRALQANPVFQRVSLLRHEAPPEGDGINAHYEAILSAPYRLPQTEPGAEP